MMPSVVSLAVVILSLQLKDVSSFYPRRALHRGVRVRSLSRRLAGYVAVPLSVHATIAARILAASPPCTLHPKPFTMFIAQFAIK